MPEKQRHKAKKEGSVQSERDIQRSYKSLGMTVTGHSLLMPEDSETLKGATVRVPPALKSLKVKPETFEEFTRFLFELQLQLSARVSTDETLAELLRQRSHLRDSGHCAPGTAESVKGDTVAVRGPIDSSKVWSRDITAGAGKPRPGRPHEMPSPESSEIELGSVQGRSLKSLKVKPDTYEEFTRFLFELQLERNARISADQALAELLDLQSWNRCERNWNK